MTENKIKFKCPKCGNDNTVKAGKSWKGEQRLACKDCKKIYILKEIGV